jgi:hypothetical protein
MKHIISSAEQVTPDWLTIILQKKGLLSHGKVNRVISGQGQANFASSVWRLEVSYSQPDLPGAPKKLFLKTADPSLAPGDFDPGQLYKESFFYSEIAHLMGEVFTTPCYDAAYDADTGASHILLKDLSDTHITCLDPLAADHCEQAVDALAHLHAYWWDHPRLGKDIGKFPTLEERQQDWADTERCTNAFMAALGDQLTRSYRTTYEQVLKALPDLFKRHAANRNLTLVHGDAHLGNYLFSKDPMVRQPYLIDWQFWHPTIGGTDLAFMIATEWEPETRRLLEKSLLQRYYHQLLANGVNGYAWEDCWNDYRLSVILVCIFIPVWRWAVFKWELDILALQRSMQAFDDLKCFELLE